MPFCVVEFEEGGLAVVPSFWLTPRKKEVYWPPVKDTNFYKKLVKREETVDEKTWKLFCIQKVFCETDDFESAEIKLKKAELTSNLDTSDEEASISIKRKRRLRRFSSSCSSGTEENSTVKRPPALKFKKGVKVRSSSSVEQIGQTVATTSRVGNTLQIHDQVISTPSLLHQTPSESPITATTEATTPHRSTLLTPTTSSKSIQIDAKAYQTLLQKLTIIQQQNVQILALLEQNNTTGVNDSEVPHFPVQIPVQSQEDLHILETFIDGSENIVVSYLSRIGGENVVVKTNRILKYMVSDKLAAEHSFFGKREKREFGKLKLFAVIRDSVKRGIKNCTDYEIEGVVKVWLKHAPQRLKKAANRPIANGSSENPNT